MNYHTVCNNIINDAVNLIFYKRINYIRLFTVKIQLSVFILLLLILPLKSISQDANLIFFEFLPQNSEYNPAVQYDSTVIIFSPYGAFDLGTNTFGIMDAFKWNKEEEKIYLDLDYVIENAEDKNFLNALVDYSLIFIGKKFPKGYYTTFSVNQRNNYNFSVPGDLFEFTRGNADYETETERDFNLDGLSVNSISYTSYSFGISKKFTTKLQFGMHMKFLNGQYVTNTRNFDALINTRQNFEEIYIEADINYQQASLYFNSDQSEDFPFNAGDFSRNFFWHNSLFKNPGLAFDFGFIYSSDEKTTILGSVADIGFINWNNGQRELHYRGSYNFAGLDLSPNDEGYFDVEEAINSVVDSIKTVFEPVTDSKGPFVNKLAPRITLGFSRNVNPFFDLYGVFRANIYKSYTDYRYTIGTILRPTSKLSLSFSTSYKNNRPGNFGAAVVYKSRLGAAYLSSENFDVLFANSASVNLSLGFNLYLLNTGSN